MDSYQPSREILRKYASVLIDFALNDGEGIKKGDVVLITAQVPGIPLARETYRRVLAGGGHPLIHITDDDFRLIHLSEGADAQLSFFPQEYYFGLAGTIDHSVRILADRDPLFLSSIDPRRIILNAKGTKPYRDRLDAKEDAGKFTWTLCLYGTGGVAHEAGMGLKEYWERIERACFLTDPDPIATWRSVYAEMHRIISVLNDMAVAQVRVEAKDTDLTIGLGEKRRWLGGRGRNIPSFEIFTSPDWRLAEGRISFELPLYRYGQIIRDISIEIRNGRVVKAAAAENEKLLLELVAQAGADKVGEFSLTDKRFSRITRFMAETLYDENFGGEFGNTHIALGKAYHDACSEDPKGMTEAEFKNLGFNDSAEHTDIIATTDRVVTATLKDGSKKIIYKGGEFLI